MSDTIMVNRLQFMEYVRRYADCVVEQEEEEDEEHECDMRCVAADIIDFVLGDDTLCREMVENVRKETVGELVHVHVQFWSGKHNTGSTDDPIVLHDEAYEVPVDVFNYYAGFERPDLRFSNNFCDLGRIRLVLCKKDGSFDKAVITNFRPIQLERFKDKYIVSCTDPHMDLQ